MKGQFSLFVKTYCHQNESQLFKGMGFYSKLPFFVSIPHSGESIPHEVTWLKELAEPTLMRDVDRFVDQLYQPVITKHQIPCVKTQWHRYVVDLNRKTDQVDQASVVGATLPAGKHPKGLHWSVTTQGEPLIPSPMSQELHQKLVQNYYQPFHDSVQDLSQKLKQSSKEVYHIDLHSMPSLGTAMHTDPGEQRAEVVISDFHGQSASTNFKDIVMKAYQQAGFQVAYNWPYVGGGITQLYGKPQDGHNTIQVELNRALYMDENTKQLKMDLLVSVQEKLEQAVVIVMNDLKGMLND